MYPRAERHARTALRARRRQLKQRLARVRGEIALQELAVARIQERIGALTPGGKQAA
jgi:hypothetical protein